MAPPALATVIVLLAILLLASCAPRSAGEIQIAAIGVPRLGLAEPGMARFTSTAFVTTDGQSLTLRKWLPQGPVKAVLLALHGFNDYSLSFDAAAQTWARDGIATYAYDQRGFGTAPGRGRWAGRATLAADASTASTILRELYPRTPLYLVGESMGGAVAIITMTGESGTPIPPVDGVILSAPAVWGRATMGLAPRVLLWAGVRLLPSMTLTGRGLDITASDNIPMLRALGRDPLVIKATRIDAIYGLVDLMDAALAAAPALHAPTLLLYGGHDEIVPREPVRDFVATLPHDPGTQRRLALYPNGYHMLTRDLDGQVVVDDIASWVLRPQAPLPSGADRRQDERPWPPHHHAKAS